MNVPFQSDDRPARPTFFQKLTRKFAPRPASDSTFAASRPSVETLLKKVRRIEIVSNRIADELFGGEYKSAFRGQGIEFAEVREYVEGDDVRTIDWNVTARAGKPYVKRYVEERERSLLFMFDVSASNLFGSRQSRLETATEIATTLIFSALKNNDKVGLLTFADGVQKYFPPRKGRNYALRLVREMLSVEPASGKTDLEAALEFANRTLKKRAVVFVLSDFYVSELGRALLNSRRKFDLVAVSINEPFESAFPNVGFTTLRDPETGATLEVDSGSKRVRAAISERLENRRRALANRLKEANVDSIFVENGEDFVPALRRFFRARGAVR